MSVTFETDGAVTLRDEADPSRTLTIPAGTPPAERDARISAFVGPALPPDNPTLGDWRVGLALWGRLADVTSKVQALVSSGHPLGVVARQRMEYSNNVLRDQLLVLRDAFGFSAAEIDESLWRASRVAAGDLSGVWPLP